MISASPTGPATLSRTTCVAPESPPAHGRCPIRWKRPMKGAVDPTEARKVRPTRSSPAIRRSGCVLRGSRTRSPKRRHRCRAPQCCRCSSAALAPAMARPVSPVRSAAGSRRLPPAEIPPQKAESARVTAPRLPKCVDLAGHQIPARQRQAERRIATKCVTASPCPEVRQSDGSE